MIYQQLFERLKARSPVRAGLIGAGDYGTAIVTQSTLVPLLEMLVVADVDEAAARAAYARAGVADDRIAACETRRSALAALESGMHVVTSDAMLLMELPLDVIVEATGIPESGALHAQEAIAHGKHVAMVNKEADSVVGPILKHMADRAGVVYTAVDGDQPGLLMGLVSWARSIGLDVICGGKARDAEFVYDAQLRRLSCHGRAVDVPEEHAGALEPISGEEGGAAARIESRRKALADLPDGDPFDLCEMVVAANATGLVPDVPALHRPALRTREIPEVLCGAEDGGVLSRHGVIDMVTCLRSPSAPGFGGGVFVVVSCENDYSRRALVGTGLMANSSGSAALIYRPHHLCGIETPLTILCAGLLGIPTGGADLRPRVDMVARAKRRLEAGTVLDAVHSTGPDLEALLVDAAPVSAGGPLPLHMAEGHALSKAVAAGEFITPEAILRPGASRLWSLRAEQDGHFLA